MAAAEQRRLLEQLMGSDPPFSKGSRRQGISNDPNEALYDSRLCRSYICGYCPHEIFINTKFDLGPCPKHHSDRFKTDYERLKQQGKNLGFELDYMRDLQKYVDDCNRRVLSAEQRLDKTPEEAYKVQELVEEMALLDSKIDALLDEVEVLGELGAISLALDQYHLIQNWKIARTEKDKELRGMTDLSGPGTNQKLTVCDICGAYLSRLDSDRRLADHFAGKMHLGFYTIRTELKNLKKELENKPQTFSHDRDRKRYDEHTRSREGRQMNKAYRGQRRY